jgi:hypothetical protein
VSLRGTISNMHRRSSSSIGARIGLLIRSVVVVLLCLPFTNAQSVEPLPLKLHRLPMFAGTKVERVCGALKVAKRGLIETLPLTELKLYAQKSEQACCKDMKLLGSQVTEGDGRFDFENIPSGGYWLTVEYQGKEMTTSILVDSRRNWEGRCAEQGLLIKGKLFTWVSSPLKPILKP